MNIWEYKEYFDKKMSSLSDDGELLDEKHKFLKLVLSTLDCPDLIVGHFELQSRGIKYDGYYEDEDDCVFHVISLVYFEDLADVTEQNVRDEFEKTKEGSFNLLYAALDKQANIGTETEVGEHVQTLKNAIDSNYDVEFDFYSNVRFPKELPTIKRVGNRDYKIVYEDIDSIYEDFESAENNTALIDFRKTYGESLTAIRISQNENYDVYLTSITGDMLAKVYDDHKGRLMDGNVRAYLKRTQKTNKGISSTIQNDPENFVAFNNGISAVALDKGSDVHRIDDNLFLIKSLDKMQIVNGGQTTVTIYLCSKEDENRNLEKVVVPIKLTLLKQNDEAADLVSNIAVFANTQTAISKSDLASNKPFYKQLEEKSKSICCYMDESHSKDDCFYWSFERTNGLYNTRKRILYNFSRGFEKKYPEKNKFSKKLLAKAVVAASSYPFQVCLGNEKCFQFFNEKIEQNAIIPSDIYYKDCISSLILWREADLIIKKAKLPIKAAVLPYTIGYIAEKLHHYLDFDTIWHTQKINSNLSFAIKIVSKTISDYFNSNLVAHPNILMWGRKPECWREILCLNADNCLSLVDKGTRKIDFFPVNLAAEFISKASNYNDLSLWSDLLRWNESCHCFSSNDIKKLQELISTLQYSMQLSIKKHKENAKTLFLKAVNNGYNFN